MSFEGKVAVVTGAASGLGLGLATALVERGARVFAADVEPMPADLDAVFVRTDVADAQDVEALREQAGDVDFLFNNAGVSPPAAPLHLTSRAVWEWTLLVNLGGVVNGVRAFVPGMRERGTGHVVNTASLMGLNPSAALAPYSATKAAVIALSLALRAELDGTGVAVSVVFPHVASAISSSVRNWPHGFGDPPVSLDPETDDATRAYVEAGMDPLACGELVLDGVAAGRLWIMPGAPEDALDSVLPPAWPR